jgi:hypothetical protein
MNDALHVYVQVKSTAKGCLEFVEVAAACININ